MEEKKQQEIVVAGKKYTVDRFISFGTDQKYFAIVGNDLFKRHHNDTYRLFKKNYTRTNQPSKHQK